MGFPDHPLVLYHLREVDWGTATITYTETTRSMTRSVNPARPPLDLRNSAAKPLRPLWELEPYSPARILGSRMPYASSPMYNPRKRIRVRTKVVAIMMGRSVATMAS